MQHLITYILSFFTGGMSDFCPVFKLDEAHCLVKLGTIRIIWHGVDVWPLVYVASFLFGTAALSLFVLATWQFIRRRTMWLLFYIGAIAFSTAALAASSTLYNLSAGSSVNGTDVFYDVQTQGTGGVKVTAAQIAAYVAGSGTSGIVTSIATGCQATGGTITTTGTISTQTVITDLSGSNPAITTGYCGGLENLDNTGAQTPTIAVAGSTGFPQSWYTDLCNINTGTQTLTPGSGTIGGASPYVLAAGTKAAPTCVRIISDAANTNYVLEFPPGSGGSVTASSTTTFTNKTLTSSTNSLGGVTAAFGSDEKGDIYTNGGSSNILVRLGIGTTGQCLVVASGLPSWASCGGGSSTITVGTTATSGFTDTHIPYSASSLIQDSGLAIPSSGVLLANGTTGPTLSSGQLAIGGVFGTPVNPGATGEGQIYLSTADGVDIQGNPGVKLIQANGSQNCDFSGGQLSCTGSIATQNNGGGGFSHNTTTNLTQAELFANTNAGTNAQEQFQFKNGNARPLCRRL